ATLVQPVRPADDDGHARSEGGRDRRPDPLPRGRPDRPRPAAVRAERSDRGDGRAERRLMIVVALKGLAARKFRASLIALAIVLGVAMISGTYVLTDTINNGFNTIFKTQYKNADVIISGKAAFSNGGNGNKIEAPTFPDTVLAKVLSLVDVVLAAGSVNCQTVSIVDAVDKLIRSIKSQR